MNVDHEIKKQLDAVVGERFDPPRPARATLLQWLVAAILAVAVAAAITAILHTHLMQAQTAPAPKKPVTIRIVPAK